MPTLKPIDLVNLLTPKEQRTLLATLQQQCSPCQRNGHRYRYVGRNMRFILPPQDKFVCSICAQVVLR